MQRAPESHFSYLKPRTFKPSYHANLASGATGATLRLADGLHGGPVHTASVFLTGWSIQAVEQRRTPRVGGDQAKAGI